MKKRRRKWGRQVHGKERPKNGGFRTRVQVERTEHAHAHTHAQTQTHTHTHTQTHTHTHTNIQGEPLQGPTTHRPEGFVAEG